MHRPFAALACLVSLALLSPSLPAAAQGRIVFSDDVHGYGMALIGRFMGDRLQAWEERAVTTRIATAQVSLNGDAQPEFFVRIENPETCDEHGCQTFGFMLVGKQWKSIFQTRTQVVGLGPRDARSGMASLFTDEGTNWAWNGTVYDVIE